MSCYTDELRPLLFLMRTCGWLPLRMRTHGKGLELRMRSPHVAYSAVVISAQMILLFTLLYRAFQVIPLIDANMQLMTMGYMFSLCFPFILGPLAALQSTAHLELCNQWASFQAGVERVSTPVAPLALGLRSWCRLASVSLLVFAALLVAPALVMTRALPQVKDVIVGVDSFMLALVVTWWHAACRALVAAATCLLADFKLLLDSKEQYVSCRVLQYRALWLQLCLLARRTGNALSLALAALVVNNLACLLFCCYQAIMLQSLEPKMMFICFGTVEFVEFVIIGEASHAAKKEIDFALMEATMVTRELNLPISTKTEVMFLLSTLSRNSTCLNLSGYISLSRALVTSCLAAVFANLIVMVQLGILQDSGFNLEQMLNFSSTLGQI